ncbi:hypothetical protein HYPSUDRAFT_201624 [Hypholoma sublateritium FD-334 SS-4]|uniref:SANT domain-containing protein n=1 Tax=Hypholoma sublateritium (strain FD-334 SS-4) TaxID=945553 RepID=A0A0D2MHE2_HYPSF|nr:hypothetical protein HYPSUDRAFT_201624 [Hypholoma sublateritium FD-334 SS-4]
MPNDLSNGTGSVVTTVSEPLKAADIPRPGGPKSVNGVVSDKVHPISTNETEIPPGLVLKEKRLSLDVSASPSSNMLSHESSTITPLSQSKVGEVNVPGKLKEPSPPESDAPVVASSSRQASKPISPPPLPPPPQVPLVSGPAASDPKGAADAPANDVPTLEIQQPVPSFRPVTPPKESRIDIDIPPTTHSPQLAESPPASPAIVTPPNTFQAPYPSIEEIPPFSEARTKEEALRIVVMTRLLCDRQTRDERVNPVLMANLSISMPLEVHPTATPDSLLERMFNKNEQEMKDRMASYIKTRPRLAMYLESRNEKIEDKQRRLREEYRGLQEKWLAHCNMLNEAQKTLASEHELQHTGRTTRRSTAFTDAVRSDFEMEQIIASLGVDDATDPNHLSMRNLAKIPDMISVTHGQVDYLFDDTSHLVENPKEYYAPHTGIDDWKDDEKAIFLDRYAAYPKQFGIIADFLPNKTPAQCVDYYYLHKNKFIDFRKVVSQMAPNKRKRRGMGKKKGNGLLVDIALHDMEVHRGAANATSASAPVTRAPRGRKSAASLEAKKALARRGGVQLDGTPTATPTPEPESTPTRGRRRKTVAPTSTNLATTTIASASATPSRAPTPIMPPPSVPATAPPSVPPSAPTSAPSSAPPSIAPTPAVSLLPIAVSKPAPPVPFMRELETNEQELESRPVKRVKRTRKIKSAAIVSEEDPPSPTAETDKALPPTTNDASESSARGKSVKPIVSVSQWSEDDKSLFIRLLSQHGDNFKRIAASMPNKTTIQVSNYYTNNLVELGLRAIAARAPMRSPSPDHPGQWDELPYAGGTPGSTSHPQSTNASRAATPPMASLTYDGQRNGHQGFLEHTRHLSSEGVSMHPALDSASRVDMHMYPGRMRPTLPPPPAMARLGAVDPFRPPRAMFSTSSTHIAYPFPTPPEQRDGFGAKYTDGGARPYGAMAMTTQPQSYYTVYPPTTPGGAAAAVHSPAGLASPPPLPMHALHPFPMPPQGESPHHTSYYAGAQPSGARRDGRTQWGAYPAYYREAPLTEAGGTRRAENAYPVYGSPPASAPAGRNGSHLVPTTLQPPPASTSTASPTSRAPWP